MTSLARLDWRVVAVLVLGYLALDWASFLHPLHGLNITPWNPAPALGLAFLLRFGGAMTLPIFVAIVAAEIWVRGLPVSVPVTVAIAAVLALGYWAIATAIARHQPDGTIFTDRRGLLVWATIVAAGTLVTSAIFVVALAATGYVPADGIGHAVFRFWVGDGVGVLVSMPLLWMLLDDYRRNQLRQMILRREFFVHLGLAAVALWIAFGVGETDQYVYVLFVPIAWAASRHGLPGAVLSAAAIQAGIIVAVKLQGIEAITLMELQVLAGVIALFGFFIGVVVDEKQRVSEELRQTLRLAAAGEMAGALAHELNQPLTALTTYGTACERLLEQGESVERLRETVSRMVAESYRAAEVLRRLRDFFRTGTTQLEPVELGDLLQAATDPLAGKFGKLGIELSVEAGRPCMLLADRLQLEIVLRNLLSNAIDAVSDQPEGQRSVRLSVSPTGIGRVRVRIEDSGSGLTTASAAQSFEPFRSSKATGLGLGLAISRAIVEAHGGSLWAEVADHGLFQMELPTEGRIEDGT